MEEANSAVCTHLESITAAAREVLLENGVRQTAAAEVTEMYFTTREYENFSPAGREIPDAAGDNRQRRREKLVVRCISGSLSAGGGTEAG